MKIAKRLASGRPCLSFEFFPPKDQASTQRLFDTIAKLSRFQPAFVSVTHGAFGGAATHTLEIVERIKRETDLEPMAHLTCISATQVEIQATLERLKELGLENLLPLRGDRPLSPVPEEGRCDFQYASDLVSFIRSTYPDFCLGGACYPEGHQEASSLEKDMENLKLKVDQGIDFLITQLFFDNRDYFAFLEKARAAGIQCPVIPGILPVSDLAQIKRFVLKCGAKIPEAFLDRLEQTAGVSDQVQRIGVEHATLQCRELLESGVPGIHFYTLNRPTPTSLVLEALDWSSER